MIKDSLVWRFWIKFDKPKEGCWEWKAAKSPKGYGLIRRSGVRALVQSHRLSWMLFNGRIPDGLCVLHKCDNTSCVNPDHLFLGTHRDNAIDKSIKGRCSCRKGEDNKNSKLTNSVVKRIRKLRKGGTKRKQLSKIFNVSISSIDKVIYKTTWKHI